MTDMTQPIGNIKPHPQVVRPFPVQNILVDDPVALVDDPVALSGGLAVPVTILRVNVADSSPIGSIQRLR